MKYEKKAIETAAAYGTSPIPPNKEAISRPRNAVATMASSHPVTGTPDARIHKSASSAPVSMSQNAGIEFKAAL